MPFFACSRPFPPLEGTTTDENKRPPLDKGGLQGGGAIATSPNLPLTPSLCKEGERYFQRASTESFAPREQVGCALWDALLIMLTLVFLPRN